MINVSQIQKFLTSEKFLELVRFGIVGITATILQYLFYWLLKFWINYNIAYTVGYILSFAINFFLTTYFTFRKKATVKKGFGFGGVHLFNYLFQMALLNTIIFFGVDESWAPIPVYLIVIPIQFILVRFVIKGKS